MEYTYKQYLLFKEKYSNIEQDKYPLLIEDIKETLTYQEKFDNIYNTKTGLHIGRAKLFLSELQFLNNHTKPQEKSIVFYVGSAPGRQLYLLGKMFPNTKFVYIDPAPFKVITSWDDKSSPIYHYDDIYNNQFIYLQTNKDNDKDIYAYDFESQNIVLQTSVDNTSILNNRPDLVIDFIKNTSYQFILIEDYFSDKMTSWINKNYYDQKIFFFSDIRSIEGKGLDVLETKSKNVSNVDVIIDNAKQLLWINLINVDATMLKFRPPYPSNQIQIRKDIDKLKESEIINDTSGMIDYIDNHYNERYLYIDGKCYIQSWAPISSTETRLVVEGIIDENLTYDDVFEKINNLEYTNKYNLKYYDMHLTENKFMFYNKIDRAYSKYKNHLSIKMQQNYTTNEIGYDYCPDCAREIDIIYEYTNFKNRLNIFTGNDISTIINIENQKNTITEIADIIDLILNRSLKKHGGSEKIENKIITIESIDITDFLKKKYEAPVLVREAKLNVYHYNPKINQYDLSKYLISEPQPEMPKIKNFPKSSNRILPQMKQPRQKKEYNEPEPEQKEEEYEPEIRDEQEMIISQTFQVVEKPSPDMLPIRIQSISQMPSQRQLSLSTQITSQQELPQQSSRTLSTQITSQQQIPQIPQIPRFQNMSPQIPRPQNMSPQITSQQQLSPQITSQQQSPQNIQQSQMPQIKKPFQLPQFK